MEILFSKHKEWLDSEGKNGEQLILENKDMTDVNIDGKILHEAKFLECDFTKKSILKTDFWKSWMCSSIFKCCIINECDFRKTELQYTEFKNANISNTNFSKAYLSEADFENAIITNSVIAMAGLNSTNFTNVIFENVDFSGAMFDKTVLTGVKFKDNIDMVGTTIKSINIGTIDNPNIIFGDEAKVWLYNKINV